MDAASTTPDPADAQNTTTQNTTTQDTSTPDTSTPDGTGAQHASADGTPVGHTWVAPLLGTLVTLPAALVAFFYVGLSPMACDSCTGEESDAFTSSYDLAFGVFGWGLLLPAGLLIAAWSQPATGHHAPRRIALSVFAPLALALIVMVFAALVEWPA